MDDDDWMEPDHITQLVEFWNAQENRTDAPLQVCGQNYLLHYSDCIKEMKFWGWHVSLFERLTPNEIDFCFKLFPQDFVIGCDMWIAYNTHFDKRSFDGKFTYHWDRVGSGHVSNHETNRGETQEKRFAQLLNFWTIKIAARATELQPVVLGKESI
jgi:hypothetical protein